MRTAWSPVPVPVSRSSCQTTRTGHHGTLTEPCRCHHVAGAGGHGARRSGDADPGCRRGRCAQADAAGASGVCTWPNTTLQVLQGRGRLMTSEASWEWVRATTCRSAHPAPVGELGRRRRPVDPGRDTIQLRETPGNLSNSGSETHQISGQPVLIAASRCYSIQMLRSALTCANGCSCWSTGRGEYTQDFPYHGCALPTELGGRVLSL